VAQPQLQAAFFVRPDGVVVLKATPLDSFLRRLIYRRDHGRCVRCGTEVALFGNTASPFRKPPAAVDHIIPRARGGQNTPSNLQLLCITCNARKGAK
jgi:5-methylcytosine-specific restriction endonuclease McrA